MSSYITIKSRKENLTEVELFLTEFFNRLRLKKEVFFRTLLSVSELVNNSISHGNNFDEEKNVNITCFWKDDLLTIIVEDEGEGFNIKEIKNPTLSENIKNERGRGLFLVEKFSDDIIFKQKGKQIEIKFKIEREG